MVIKQRLLCIFLLFLALFSLAGCKTLEELTKTSSQPEKILKPSSADVSPNMDFNKIKSIAVFPLFPGAGVIGGMQGYDNPKYAEDVAQALTSELAVKQSQWNIRTPKEVLDAINRSSLGRGYKNLQADYNTSSGQLTAFTAETQKFLATLAKKMDVDGFIFGNYVVVSQPTVVKTILGPVTRNAVVSRVNVALFYAKDKAVWWRATSEIKGLDNDAVVKNIAKSLASYVGKGTLRQL